MKFLKKNYLFLSLAAIFLIIGAANYKPGTWLAGWDNLLPELNIFMNLKRNLVGVWQEHQGLGLVGGMGHIADLTRQIIILPLVLILPHQLIRWLWHFGMLVLGTLGIYWGLGKLKKFNKLEKILASLFYLLNFGTIQIFWVPFEAFSTFWGFFPWLIFSFYQLMNHRSSKNWRRFILLNLLAVPSFYVPTLFLVYCFCLVCLWLPFVFKQKEAVNLKAFWLVLLINLFWLLPFGFFVLTSSSQPRLSFSNQIASEETFLRNQKRGTIADFFLLRGYYYDFGDDQQLLMQPWVEYFSKPGVLVLGYILAAVVILGLFKASKKFTGLVLIFLLSALALLSATPPFSYLNWLLRQSPFINQVFRSPFTKFVVPAAFSFSIFLAFGLKTLRQKIGQRLKVGVYALTFVCLLIFSWPIFQGNLFYSRMKVMFPQEYFQLIEFFKNQPKTSRIANLPQGDFWGWTFYRWPFDDAQAKGLRGSGFLWYGIEQPILDRTFDVWNLKNEQYYWELNYALQNNNPVLLKQVLDKYFVKFVIFDDHVIFPGGKEYARLALDTKQLLNDSEFFEKVAVFGSLEIFQLKNSFQPSLVSYLPSVYPFGFTQKDPASSELGLYQLDDQNPDVYYPFASLFTNRFQSEINFKVEEKDDDWLISVPTPAFEMTFPKGETYTVNFQELNLQPRSCRALQTGDYHLELLEEDSRPFIRLISQDNSSCFEHYLGDLPLDRGWLVEVEYRHQQGYPLLSAGFDGWSKYKFFFTKLEQKQGWQKAYFVIPAYQLMDYGLVLRFDNVSFNKQTSINDVAGFRAIPFPWEELKRISIKKAQESDGPYFILPESFDHGWVAMDWQNGRPRLLKHVMVNGWANGWQLDNEDQKPLIFFWPQILEYLGLAALVGITIFIIWSNKQPKR